MSEGAPHTAGEPARALHSLDRFAIEIPSWGFANTGTRFGKYLQAGAATTLEEKFQDAAQVHALTGATPSLALHVQWDLPRGMRDADTVQQLVADTGIQAGSINPNLFEDQEYKFGSLCHPDAEVRSRALDHVLASIEIAKALGSRDLSLWVPDGSNYPGAQSMRDRIVWLGAALRTAHNALGEEQRLLIEYKPFEPAFYHTDIADWGMAAHFAREAGPRARVLVDTGHHYQAQNLEQIVAWLLHLQLLGGFHLNDRRYADDDLTTGSIDPYQVFRIFHEILNEPGDTIKADVAFMVDQSHNIKGKLEAVVQTVMTAQELMAKAALVDRVELRTLQAECRTVAAEECLRTAFWTDVRPLLRQWRTRRGLPEDPLVALWESGYVERAEKDRGKRNAMLAGSYA